MDLKHWINDGFMTIFFFVVGLEIRREVTSGYLASKDRLMLPLFAALGGMAVPALLYLLIAGSVASHGWGVPMATDIALAIGLLSALGSRVPQSLRAFLLGIAVVDDIAAIVVIALFYSSGVSLQWLAIGAGTVLFTLLMRQKNLQNLFVYFVCALVLWFALHEAGVHATIAGVIMGFLVPHPEKLEHRLHPWSAFLVVPLFALTNAGIEISTQSMSDALSSRIAWGIFAGLLLGKPLGIFVTSFIASRSGRVTLPERATKSHILGIGQTAGIGFTVAIFISELAFTTDQHRSEAKLAILSASIFAAVLGAVFLRRTPHTVN